LHLERCLKDLRERFARIELVVSPPLFSFRETITEAPRRAANAPSPSVEQHTANRLISVRLLCPERDAL
jgi:ribosome assembly protein 1